MSGNRKSQTPKDDGIPAPQNAGASADKASFLVAGAFSSLLPLFTFTNVKGMAFFSNIVIVIIVSAVAAFLLSQAYGVAAGNKRIKITEARRASETRHNQLQSSSDGTIGLQANAYAVASVNVVYYVAVFLLSSILPLPVAFNYILTTIGGAFAVSHIVS